ncbi:MAG: glycosyltransferase family 4 protein [Verrucomicrobiota bacterium]
MTEHPWPELAFKFRQRFWRTPGNAWIRAAQTFDRWAACQIPKMTSRAIVCSENCARHTFQAAAERGWTRIYDCPGHNAKLCNEAAQEAARRFGLPCASEADTPEITHQKEIEIALADVVLTYSTFHANGVASRGVAREKIVVIPLWTDPDFWNPTASERSSEPLRVIFAGGINLRKGVPFLIEAVRKLAPQAQLTLVGSLDQDAKPCLAGTESFVRVLSPVPKIQLRALYRANDVLVLPSLGDSFGFVGLEAMACGLPVVVTTNCGVPVPDESWRVPVMDSDAIARRLQQYIEDRAQLAVDSERARAFAVQFTPQRYRATIGDLYRRLLA